MDEKNAQRVQSVFGSIARRYDLANHVMSLGIDRRWRSLAVKLTDPQPGERLLDMCCGTGDLAFAFAKAGVKQIVGCDFSAEMLELARVKQGKHAHNDTVFTWQVADCTATDLESESFDIVSCAFGVRNMADLSAGLAEIHRLLKPGGRACILEFTLPKNPLVRAFYMPYFKWILPLVGGVISGDLAAYKYLSSSVQEWHSQIDLAQELKKTGFATVNTTPLSAGIAAIYLATK